jgi:AcrR family transcriptional regulator
LGELTKKRARADADKQTRRQDILQAAALAFADEPLSAVTMAEVARRAGLAKGTVYLYFPTKEALFLQLLTEALALWFERVAAELTPRPSGPAPQPTDDAITADALAELLVRSLVGDAALARLLALLHPVLEQNIDDALALAFKRRVRDQVAVAGVLLERRFRGFGPDDGARFLLQFHAVVVGLHAATSPSPAVARALALPEMASLRVDFAGELLAVTGNLLRGWRARGG